MKKNIVLLLLLLSISALGQTSPKKYKYITVPVQYNFTSEPNQFQINVLTRVLLKETNFEVYMNEGEKLPNELAKDQCLGLKANVIKVGGLFTTTLKFQLKNCFGNTIYESTGTSRKKPFKDAYHECLKNAIRDFQVVSSQYFMQNIESETPAESVNIDNKNSNIPFKERAKTYKEGNKTYWLTKEKNNYILYQDQGKTIFATLEQADRGTYSFDSSTIDGAAYFDAEGNLIVEYLAKDKDAVQKLIFKKQ
ncbi:hypothetical protein [Mesohalobacter halotolerans]|uniref:Uncharacterized protein n=1 Tax=Mesohalobacter halotolerans TaxID=1883405 RepID=A0A4U5TU55_9FLAO|nr:hypothetical protein [Mesohalobacter halotolerans]MBS3739530.1 hypothetical protein [Psychroflexus sp.]TKS57632.1 hypothetical protein FCN74_04240 [Mesohalobacter halotolerans]